MPCGEPTAAVFSTQDCLIDRTNVKPVAGQLTEHLHHGWPACLKRINIEDQGKKNFALIRNCLFLQSQNEKGIPP
jgi:hypothetical protein